MDAATSARFTRTARTLVRKNDGLRALRAFLVWLRGY